MKKLSILLLLILAVNSFAAVSLSTNFDSGAGCTSKSSTSLNVSCSPKSGCRITSASLIGPQGYTDMGTGGSYSKTLTDGSWTFNVTASCSGGTTSTSTAKSSSSSAKVYHNLYSNTDGHGSLSFRHGTDKVTSAYEGAYIVVDVYPSNGYKLASISASGATMGSGASSYGFAVGTSNVTVSATFTPIIYNIEYVLDGVKSTSITPTTYTIETETIALPVFKETGYAFSGWNTSSTFGESTKISQITKGSTGDLKLYAKHDLIEYEISYDFAGGQEVVNEEGSPNPSSYTYESEEIVLNSATRIGYDFEGWFNISNEKIESIVAKSVGDVSLTAHWSPINYKLSYKVNGEDVSTQNRTSFTIETETFALEGVSQLGYSFNGWYTNKDCVGDKVNSISHGTYGDLVLYALLTRDQYDITYFSDGAKVSSLTPSSYSVEDDDLTLPAHTKTGYSFDGWYTVDGLGVETRVEKILRGSTGNLKLYAKWSLDTYTITYELNGGSIDAANPASYTYESENFTLKDPSKTGYIFGGWYTTSTFEESSKITGIAKGTKTGNLKLYAKWSLDTYTITYELNGGSINATNPASYTYESEDFTLKDPSKTGYIFGGWYTTSTFEESSKITGIAKGTKTGNLKLYAKWSLDTYTITYELDGGSIDATNPTSYTYESENITLNEPTKVGYAFEGWYTTSTYAEDSKVTGIEKNSTTGNKTFYAKWNFILPKLVDGCYEISNADELYGFAAIVNGTNGQEQNGDICGKLTDDIVVNTGVLKDGKLNESLKNEDGSDFRMWTPIGGTSETALFGGSFDGQGHVISGLYCVADKAVPESDDETFAGLFGVAYGDEGNKTIIIKNVGIVDSYMEAGVVGAIAGVIYNGVVQNCFSQTYLKASFYGGFIAFADTLTIENSYDASYHENGTFGDVESGLVFFGNEVTFVNSYSLCTKPADIKTCVTEKSFKDGSVAFALHNFKDENVDGSIWGQNAGDNAPSFTKNQPDRYSLTLMPNGGSFESFVFGSYAAGVVNTLPVPVREGYSFAYWYDNEGLTGVAYQEIAADVSGAKTFYAKWSTLPYEIKYVLNGGDNAAENPTIYTIETESFELKDPSRVGYDFEGWFSTEKFEDGSQVTGITKGSSGNVTFYAQWTPFTYKIAFVPEEEGTSAGNVTGYTIESETIELKVPKKDGYTFDGWYSTSTLEQDSKVEKITKGSFGDTVFYGKWTMDDYTIVYELNGGSLENVNPESYTIESETFGLNNPTRKGFEFGGWYTDKNFTEESQIAEVKTGSTGNLTIYAKWNIILPNLVDGCYEISNADELYGFAAIVNGEEGQKENRFACGKLVADITVNTDVLKSVIDSDGNLVQNVADTLRVWTPIGVGNPSFAGTFDGQNHTVSGLYLFADYKDNLGLFGYVSGSKENHAKISNVKVVDSYFYGYRHVGGVVGYAYHADFENLHGNNFIQGYNSSTGGVFGKVEYSTTTNCSNVGRVNGKESVGGVFGEVYYSTVKNCINKGSVNGHYYVGGLGGEAGETKFTNCNNSGNLSSTSNYLGGFLGKAFASDIKECFNTGSLSGVYGVGGLVGEEYGGSWIRNSYNTGSVSASTDIVGGLVGFSNGGNVVNSFNTGDVSGTKFVGGIFGYEMKSVMMFNVFCLIDAIGYEGQDGGYQANQVDLEAFANGSVASSLHLYEFDYGEQSLDGAVWGQYVGHEDLPSLTGTVKFDVEYVLNGGSFEGVVANKREVGSVMNLPTPSHKTLDFVGWYDNAQYKGSPMTSINADASVSLSENKKITLYAKWIKLPKLVDNCYEIYTADELYGFASIINGTDGQTLNRTVCGRLMNDIVVNKDVIKDGDLNEDVSMNLRIWTPLGSDWPYQGNFDGQGFSISGLYYEGSSSNIGFIASAYGNPLTKVNNLHIKDSYFKGVGSVGGIVGNGYNVAISNSTFSGVVVGSSAKVGGLVGCCGNGEITNSKNFGSVKGSSVLVGGLVGYVDRPLSIYNSANEGSVSGYYTQVGGLVGLAVSSVTMANVYNVGDVECFNNCSVKGGLVGQSTSSLSIANGFSLAAPVNAADYEGVSVVSQDAFKNGTVSSALHNYSTSVADGSVWGQYVGHEDFPSFTGAVVFDVEYALNEGVLAEGSVVTHAMGSVTTLPEISRVGHTFDGWFDNAEFSGDAVTQIDAGAFAPDGKYKFAFYAKWTINKYKVVFVDEDEVTVLKDTVEYVYGTSADDIAVPEAKKENTLQYTYSFFGWDKALSMVSENVVYKATYKAVVNQYTVTFVDDDGKTVISSKDYDYGTLSDDIDEPVPAKVADAQYSYLFLGWDKKVTKVTGDVTYTARYLRTENRYTVTFIDFDKTVLGKQSVDYGKSAMTPANPKREGYKFTGWDSDYSKIVDDLTVTAQYEKIAVGSSSSVVSSSSVKPASSSSSSVKGSSSSSAKSSSSSKARSSSSKDAKSSSSYKVDAVASAVTAQFRTTVIGRNVQIAGAHVGASYAILDMQGRVVRAGRVGTANFNVDLSRAGSYMVRVGNQSMRVNVK